MQQIIYDANYNKLSKFAQNLDNYEIRDKIQEILTKVKNKIKQSRELCEQIKNSNGISGPKLNWYQNLAIQQIAEQLGIFENPPIIDEELSFLTPESVDFENLELDDLKMI